MMQQDRGKLYEELQLLTASHLVGDATPDEIERLEELVVSSPEARQLYIAIVKEESSLNLLLAVNEATELARQVQSSAYETPDAEHLGMVRRGISLARQWTRVAAAIFDQTISWHRHPVRFVTAVALLTLVMWSAWGLILRTGHPDRDSEYAAVHSQGMSVQFVAQLVRSIDAEWEADGLQHIDGRYLPKDLRMKLKQGSALIRFQQGAELCIAGPTELILEGPNACRLSSGRLYAVVGPLATGFAVAAPSCRVVDRGTEFGVVVPDRDEAEVHVFTGLVDLVHVGQSRRLKAGEAVIVRGDTQVAQATDRQSFLKQFRMDGPLVALMGSRRHRDRDVVTYVDATPANTTVNGQKMIIEPAAGFNIGDANGHLIDRRWSQRDYGNSRTIFTVHPGDGPVTDTLRTTIAGLEEGEYRVFAYMWSANNIAWDIAAGLNDNVQLQVRAGEAGMLPAAKQTFSRSTLTVSGPHQMWAVELGTCEGTGFSVRVNIRPGDDRTWYDGVGYARLRVDE